MRLLRWLAAACAVLVIVAGAFLTLAALRPDPVLVDPDATDLTGVSWGRDFHLIADDGQPRKLGDFRGKVVALYFGYTRCPDVCPLTMANLAQAMRLLGDDAGRVQGLFVTVDPKHDKPPVLGRYVRAFDESFVGLYGDSQATERTADEFKVAASRHHSAPVFLFDRRGRLRLMLRPEATAEAMARDVRVLLAESHRRGDYMHASVLSTK
jgi:protein SCO1/2